MSSMSTPSPIVEVRDLVKRFGTVTAVDQISFSIGTGEAFGLLGPNGAGKTTTIRMLTTLIPPTSGIMRIAGVDVVQNAMIVRRVIGYIPQLLSADGDLTGYENLLMMAKLLRMDRTRRERDITRVLDLLHLDEAADRLVSTYSGGMIRRLEIGQAILHRPRLLILDEPTLGLDPTARRSVWEALGALREQHGITVLITTHYMEEADEYCQRIAIMDRGRIVEGGTPASLKARSGQPGATLEDVFTAVTGNTLESGGSYQDVQQLRGRTQRFE
jgi:ABC-2 type transport system ATP-binding protein